MIVKAPNADFDGDSVNCSIALDNIMAERWNGLRPEYNCFQLDIPDKVHSNIAIPKPVISASGAWIDN